MKIRIAVAWNDEHETWEAAGNESSDERHDQVASDRLSKAGWEADRVFWVEFEPPPPSMVPGVVREDEG